MNLKPLVGAALGAFLGAAIWAGISILVNYEHALVAWGIGGLVGFGAALMGGRGQTVGVVCALLAFGAIFTGKMFAAQYQVDSAIAESASIEMYEEIQWDAEQFAALVSESVVDDAMVDEAIAELGLGDDESSLEVWEESVNIQLDLTEFAVIELRGEYAQFMVDHGYTEASYVADVSEEEISDFEMYVAGDLLAFHEAPPAFEDWSANREADQRAYIESEFPVAGLVVDDLSPIDFIFVLLGVATAYQIGASGLNRDEEEETVVAATTEAEV